MSLTITTNDGRNYKKPDFNKAGGVIAGSIVASVFPLVSFPFVNGGLNKIRKINLGVDTVEISKGLDKALEISKMKEAGVKIIEPDFRTKQISNSKIYDKILELQNPLVGASRGRNAAFYIDGSNRILLKKKNMGTAGFHEIGHAINSNSSKFWKTLQNLRMPGMYATGVIILTALFKRKKNEGEKPEGFFDKTTTFIKDNVGKLTFVTGLPVLLEELKASSRGNDLAKKVLSPELAKKVIKTNKISGFIYITGTLLTAFGAYLASKTRDAIAQPKQTG